MAFLSQCRIKARQAVSSCTFDWNLLSAIDKLTAAVAPVYVLHAAPRHPLPPLNLLLFWLLYIFVASTSLHLFHAGSPHKPHGQLWRQTDVCQTPMPTPHPGIPLPHGPRTLSSLRRDIKCRLIWVPLGSSRSSASCSRGECEWKWEWEWCVVATFGAAGCLAGCIRRPQMVGLPQKGREMHQPGA